MSAVKRKSRAKRVILINVSVYGKFWKLPFKLYQCFQSLGDMIFASLIILIEQKSSKPIYRVMRCIFKINFYQDNQKKISHFLR